MGAIAAIFYAKTNMDERTIHKCNVKGVKPALFVSNTTNV